MQFIKNGKKPKKSQEGSNSHESFKRHCLYTVDADLIMRALSAHEKYFSLIRETTTFGRTQEMITPEESEFQLFNISLMREYLSSEFLPMKLKLQFDYDIEKPLMTGFYWDF